MMKNDIRTLGLCAAFFQVYTPFDLVGQGLEWVHGIGGGQFDRGQQVAVGPDGGIHIAVSGGGIMDMDPGDEQLLSEQGNDMIAKFDGDGQLLWARQFRVSEFHDLHIGSDGSVLAVGYFGGTIDLDPGPAQALATCTGIFCGFVVALDMNGDHLWSGLINSADAAELFAVVTDESNTVYLTGMCSGSTDLDPGPGEAPPVVGASFGSTILVKLNAQGEYQWGHVAGDLNRGLALAVTPEGDVVCAGMHDGITDLQRGPGTVSFTSNSGDAFVVKWDPEGAVIWAKTFGNSFMNDEATAVAVGPDGEVYVGGYFSFNTDMDPGTGVSNLTANTVMDVFLVKYNAAGEFDWAERYGGNVEDSDECTGLSVGAEGEVYMSGTFAGTGQFDGYTLNALGTRDGFLMRVDADGTRNWVRGVGAATPEDPLHSCSDVDAGLPGHVVATGWFFGLAPFDAPIHPEDPPAATSLLSNGAADAFVAKYGKGSFVTVAEIAVERSLGLWPQPASDHLQIRSWSNLTGPARLSVRSTDGRLVLQQDHSAAVFPLTIDVQGMSSGTYVLELQDQSSRRSALFVVE